MFFFYHLNLNTGLWKIDTVAKKWKLYLLICLDCWFVLIVDHLIVVVVVPAWFTSHNSKKTLILLVTLLSDKMNFMIQKPTGNCQWKCYWSLTDHWLVLVSCWPICDGYNSCINSLAGITFSRFLAGPRPVEAKNSCITIFMMNSRGHIPEW